ncbi:MAG TPA: MarR family transcriptional regulator [Acidimicrobiales bacterium]|nr:MarR family transcriptional regulator [Acidimicrobiales bacterium]
MSYATEAGDALLVASRALVGVAARSLAGVGDVTLPQFRVLVLVSSRDRTTVSDLAAALGVHSTSASRLCDRLVRKRLLQRREAAEDRRQTDLFVTAAGRRLVSRVTQRRRRDLAAIAERMGEAAAADAVRVLRAFAAAAEEALQEADLFGWETADR